MHQSATHKFVWRTLLVLTIAFSLQACAKINHLREAQSTFSETAAMENRLTLNLLNTAGGSASRAEIETQIRAGYASVLVSLEGAAEDQAAVLKKHKLYGNMLMLRAMTYWRLGNTTQATKEAAAAAKLPDGQIFPRDKAMATAMPGLVRNSQAHAIVTQHFEKPVHMSDDAVKALRKSTYGEVDKLIKSAIGFYDTAIGSLATNHGLLVYLKEAKLSAYKNWIDGYAKFRPGRIFSPAQFDPIRSARNELQKSMCTVAKVEQGNPLPGVEFARLVSWSLTLGLKVSENKC